MANYSKRLENYLSALDNHGIEYSTVLQNAKLPVYMLTKVAYSRCGSDDLIQEGNLGLIQAASGGYDHTQSAFNTYAGKAILRRMYSYAKAHQLTREEEHATATLTEETEEFKETLSTATKNKLHQSLKLLSKREYSVIQSLYFGSLNMSDIAKELGISRQAVAQYKESALLKLRKEFL